MHRAWEVAVSDHAIGDALVLANLLINCGKRGKIKVSSLIFVSNESYRLFGGHSMGLTFVCSL